MRRSMTPTVSISGSANSHKAVTGVIADFSPPCDSAMSSQAKTKPSSMLPLSPRKTRARAFPG
ncbi:MAG: hypothetical protein AW07_01188 [Candidatus Accumulibacter sp. SK-11]|nr:MAG: hypothetical protein AW07_01188 [Candidatus Accumulibacter sp. SK-11]